MLPGFGAEAMSIPPPRVCDMTHSCIRYVRKKAQAERKLHVYASE